MPSKLFANIQDFMYRKTDIIILPPSGSHQKLFLKLLFIFLILFTGFNLIDSEKGILGLEALKYYLDQWGFVKMIYYWLVYSICILTIMTLLFSTLKYIRLAGFLLLLFFYSIELSYLNINGYGTGLFEWIVATTETSFAFNAFETYRDPILLGILYAVILAGLSWLLVKTMSIRFKPVSLIIVPITFLLVSSVIWRTNAFIDQFPPIFKIPVTVTFAMQSPLSRERDPIKLSLPQNQKAENLVFIIDESVRGDFLSINGFSKETTPFLESINDKLINLGIASSAANCSQNSNIILQSGIRLDQLPDKDELTLTYPSIFQYAKTAGYSTYWLEGQYSPGTLPPRITSYDLKYVDEFFQIDKSDQNKSGYFTDFTLAERIKEIVSNGKSNFILINKMGTHFQYDSNYPPEEKHFAPTLAVDSTINELNEFEVLANVDRTRMVNSYCNALRWNVDKFFEKLLIDIDLNTTSIVYTSDHGQNLKEGSNPVTHCSTNNPPPREANIPMLVLGEFASAFFDENLSNVRDRTSHFQLFPTLLTFMGYNNTEIADTYGVPLWERDFAPRKFLSGDLFGRGSQSGLNDFRLETTANILSKK